MKVLKTMICMIMAGLMVFSMAACHPKDETAVTINGIKITSALYMAALLQANEEAKTKVSEDQKKNNTTSSDSTSSIDYYAQKIEGKKYVDYVKARALEICSEFAAYDVLKKDGKYTVSADKLSEADYYAQYYWSQGYSQVYEANGISLDTYKKQVKYSYMADAYFLSLYGAGGSKAVDKSTIASTMKTKYELVKRIDVQFTSDMTDTQKTALKTQLNGYLTRLKSGTSFETIYNEYNKKTDTSTSSENEINMDESSNVSSSTTTSSKASSSTSSSVSSTASTSSTTSSGTAEPEAKDKLASVVGASDTDSADPNFDEIKKMKVGEAKLFTLANDGGLSLVVRSDITVDPYYLTSLNDSILRLLKSDEFKTYMKTVIKAYTVKENKYATDRFSVKGIKYPQNTAQ